MATVDPRDTQSIIDKNTKNLLDQVSQQINANNAKLGVKATLYTNPLTNWTTASNTTAPINMTPINMIYSNTGGTPSINIIPSNPDPIAIIPSPNIDMNNKIYQNGFEESGSVEIGKRGILDAYGNYSTENAYIGLIDEVSENEEDLYAKFTNGEIIPFKGHQERISIEINTWNDLKRSDLIGNEIKKVATCHIMINDRLARIIESTDAQDLLMKADRAIDELKAMPFSICRDADSLIGREIYYDNQPAIITGVDEPDNFIYIIPDSRYINNFNPPVSTIEEGESEDWITKFGKGMLIRDYDDKIWWWRNTKSNSGSDLKKDLFYGQFSQPIPPTPVVLPSYTTFTTLTSSTQAPNIIYPNVPSNFLQNNVPPADYIQTNYLQSLNITPYNGISSISWDTVNTIELAKDTFPDKEYNAEFVEDIEDNEEEEEII